MNRALERLLGYTREEMIGDHFSQRLTPQAAAEAEDRQRRAQAGEKLPSHFESEFVHKNGTVIPVECHTRSLRDKSGNIVGFQGSYQDITERKQTMASLEHDRSLFMGGPVTVFRWIATDSWPVDYVSANVTQFGYRSQDLENGQTPFARIISPEDLDRVTNEIHLAQEGGENSLEQEYRILTADGQLRWIYSFTNIVRSVSGEVTHYDGYMLDITERKKNEEALQLTQFTVDRAAEEIFWIEPDAHILYVNDAVCSALGYSREELLAMTVHDIDPNFPEAAWPDFWAQIKREGSLTFESMEQAKDGSRFPTEINCNFIEFNGKEYISTSVRDITKRKQEEELRRLAQFSMEHAADAMFWIGPDAKLTYVNEAACRTLGYSQDELLTMAVYDLEPSFPPEAWPERWENMKQTKVLTLESEHQTKHGRRFPVEITANYFEFDGKEYNFASARDVSERKQADEALQQEKEYTSRIVEQTPALIAGVTSDGITAFINPAVTRVTGYAAQEIVGTPWWQTLYPGEEYQQVEQLFADMEQANVSDYEMTLTTRAGERRVVAWNSIKHEDEHNNLIEIIGFGNDITERKRAEEAFRRHEERWQLALQGTSDGIWDWNVQSNEVFFSKRWKEMLGFAEHELENSFSVWEQLVHPDDKDQALLAIQDHFAHRTPLYRVEMRMRCKDGSYKWILARAQALWNEAGAAARLVGSHTDIHSDKQLQRELEQAKEAAEAASRSKSEFLATMSHEIRTPMNGVIGMTGLLLDTTLSTEQQEYAETVRNSADALLTIINDILDFSKIEAGKMEIEPVPFDLRSAIEEMIDLLAPKAREQQIELILDFPATTPTQVIGDPGRIRQILTNLTGNAIKFTHEGYVSITVESQAEVDKCVPFRFIVKDTGIGIPEEKQHALFEKFTQADASTTREYGGTGLGLAICQQLVELMGGSIGVQSVFGSGSTFWFTLSLPMNDQIVAETFPVADLKDVRALIVDDNVVNRRVLHAQLTNWEMRPTNVASAEEALDVLRNAASSNAPYQVALLDHHMPGMDGETLGRRIQADPLLQPTRLVMLTSLAERSEGIRSEPAPFSAFLTKPARQAHLYNALVAALGGPAPAATSGHRDDLPAAPPPSATSDTAAQSYRVRILLAEDNIINQKVAARMIEKMGYRADVAANGHEAVDMLERMPYDLVLMDCQMPEMDGYEATAEIRRRQSGDRRIPIIAMTANAMQGDREKCLSAGMDDYVSKPIKPDLLKEALERLLPTDKVEDKAA